MVAWKAQGTQKYYLVCSITWTIVRKEWPQIRAKLAFTWNIQDRMNYRRWVDWIFGSNSHKSCYTEKDGDCNEWKGYICNAK